jgi:uncharacterized protein YdhG (YjbR/CyaY superfamily)
MKVTPSHSSIDEYIDSCPPEVRKPLQQVRRTIQKAAPGAVEAISYQMPTFKLNGKNLVHFAAWKHHIGFYPTPSATSKFKKALSAYKGAKGSVQFPLDEPMPVDLIKGIVAFRVSELEKKLAAAKRKRT